MGAAYAYSGRELVHNTTEDTAKDRDRTKHLCSGCARLASSARREAQASWEGGD